jgi:hypothetical protein
MANLGDMVVRVVGDNSELDAAIDKSKKKSQDFLNEMSKIGKQMSVLVTAPIVAGLGLAVKSYAEAEAATKRLSGAIQLAGTFTAGATERLAEYATGLMRTTGVSDELIRNLIAQAVSMGRTEEEAKKLAAAAVDIAARGIMPLDAAFETLQVTYEGIGIRSKELRAITGDLTVEQLKAGVAVDRVGAAVKGAGVEMRNTTEGSAKNFKNSIDELGESFGAVIAPAFNKLMNTIAGLADGFAALDGPTKKAIVAGAGVLAVAGPLLVIIPKIVTAIRAMGTAFATSAGPIGLIVTGVALLVAGIVKIIALSKEFADNQKLMDDAVKGNLKSTADYTAALELQKKKVKELQEAETSIAVIEQDGLARNYVSATTKRKQSEDAIADMKKIQDNLDAQKNKEEALAETERKRQEDAKKAEQEEIDRTQAALDRLAEVGQANATWNDAAIAQIRAQHDAYQAAQDGVTEITNKTWEDVVQSTKNGQTQLVESETETQQEIDARRQEEHDREVARQFEILAIASDTSKSIAEAIGRDMAAGTLSWKSFGEAALKAIGRIISAIGDELSASAAADVVKGIAAAASILMGWAAPGFFASAAIKAAGAFAAWASGALLSNVKLAEGGILTARPGGVPFIGAEAGKDEAVIPLDRLDEMLSKSRGMQGEGGGDLHLIVRIAEREIIDTVLPAIFPATRNRTVLLDGRAIVSG